MKRSSRGDKIRYYYRKTDEAEQAAIHHGRRKLLKVAKELNGVKNRYNGVIKMLMATKSDLSARKLSDGRNISVEF